MVGRVVLRVVVRVVVRVVFRVVFRGVVPDVAGTVDWVVATVEVVVLSMVVEVGGGANSGATACDHTWASASTGVLNWTPAGWSKTTTFPSPDTAAPDTDAAAPSSNSTSTLGFAMRSVNSSNGTVESERRIWTDSKTS